MSSKLRLAYTAALFVSIIAVPLAADDANDRLVAGGRSLTNGRPAEARVELQGALEGFRETKNATGEAVTLMLLATAEVNLSNDGLARDHLQSALKTLRKRHDVIGTWLALVNLAQMERAIGHYGAALAWQDEARSVLGKAEASDAPSTLATFNLMASAFGLPAIDLADAPPGAEDYLQAIMLEAVAKPLTHDGYAGILIEVGQYDRAEKELNAAVAGAGLFAEEYQYTFAAHLGELRYRQRRFAEARVQYEKALEGSLRMPLNPLGNQWIKVGIYGRLAELEIAENHIEEALAWNDRALEAVRGAQNSLKESAVLEERGLLLLQGDRLAEAEAAFQLALKIAIESHNVSQQASIEGHLADLSMLAGKYGTAVAHLEEAIRLNQMLHDRVTEGLLWMNLAVLYIVTSKDDAADVLLTHARELAETSQIDLVRDLAAFLQTFQALRKGTATKSDLTAAFQRLTANPQFTNIDIHGDAERALRESLALAGTASPGADSEKPIMMSIYAGLAYSNEARRQLENGNTAAARRLFEKALNANSTGELRARYQAAIGACDWRDGNVEQAVRWFTAAAATLDLVIGDLRVESMLVSFLGSRDHRAYYDVLIEALLRDHQDEKAFEITERARARGFLRLGDRQASPVGTESGLAGKANEIRLQIEHWDTAPVTGETLDNLILRYEVLRSRIQSVSQSGAPEDAPMTGMPPLSLVDVWQELPDHTTLISYFVSPLGAHAWVLDGERIEHVNLALDSGRMKRITCWAAGLGHDTRPAASRGGRVPGDCGSDSATSEEVYEALIAPLRGKIRNSRLMILPHGDLHYVPFAALYDPRRKHYLVEDYTLVHLPSASALRLLRARESPIHGGALVLGDPDVSGPTSLPGANQELQRVATMLHTAAKIGKEASEDLLYQLDGKVDLLHIAAHGIYNPASPFFSTIDLAGSDKRNGRLTVDEILSDLDLSGVNLVVLAACQSAVGQRSGGDDVVGLTRALLYAGSPGVISALWNIDDQGTTPLIEKFYAGLLAGSTAADALREAQVAMLHDARYSAPRFWAAFLLTGDPTGKWTGAGPSSPRSNTGGLSRSQP